VRPHSAPGLPDGVFSDQKYQRWANFGGSCNGRCWHILCPIGMFYVHLPYLTDIWYISWLFGIFFPFWFDIERKIWQHCSAPSLRKRSTPAFCAALFAKFRWKEKTIGIGRAAAFFSQKMEQNSF
jgi:hypothetical protein